MNANYEQLIDQLKNESFSPQEKRESGFSDDLIKEVRKELEDISLNDRNKALSYPRATLDFPKESKLKDALIEFAYLRQRKHGSKMSDQS